MRALFWVRVLLVGLLLLPSLSDAAVVKTATLQSAATATGNGTAIDLSGRYSSIAVTVTISATATITFEGAENTTYASVTCISTASTSGTLVTTATATGQYQCGVAGLASFRARISSYSSGTVTVTATASDLSLGKKGGGGSSSPGVGSADAVQGTDGAGALTDTGCTGTGGAITCTNGFVAGSGSTIGKVDMLEGTAPGAPSTANHHNIYVNSTNSTLESQENAGTVKTYGYASAAMTAGRCVQVASGGGTQIESASAACGAGGTAGSPLFVQTASATAVTAAAETTILSTGTGSKTIPAAWFTAAGTVMDVRFSGKYSTGAVPGTLQLKLKFGSTVVAQTAAFTPIVSVTDGVYSGFIRLIARTVGASGTIFVADGLLTTGSTITPGEIILANPTLGTAVTIDTTATQVVDLTATWGTGATNSITGFTFEMVGPGSAVSSAFGRTGAVVATANDYTWGQLAAGTGTNLTLDAEGTGNTLSIPVKRWYPGAGCNNATAGPVWDLPATTPAVAACGKGTNIQKGVLQFADTTGGFSAQITDALPADWTTTGGVDIDLYWTTTATTGNAKWSVSTACSAVNASATDDPAFNTANTVTTAAPGTANQVKTSNITGLTMTGCTTGTKLLFHVKLFRDGNDAADTIAATANFIGAMATFRRAM